MSSLQPTSPSTDPFDDCEHGRAAVAEAAIALPRTCNYSWDPTTGLQLFTSPIDTYNTVGGPTVSFTAGGIQLPSGDDCPLDLNNNGDIAFAATFTLLSPSSGAAAVRTRLGSLGASPSAIAEAAGGTQTMTLDAGVANANNLYLVMGAFAGTTPGIPIGGGWTVPLNFPLYTNSLGFLDAQGKGTASLVVPGALSSFAGLTIHHAFGVIDGLGNVTHISRPCGLLLY